MTATDYPDWQTPLGNAAQIAVNGVPLLRLTNNLMETSGTVVAGGAMVALLAPTSINQPSYEMTLAVSMPAASGTVPFVHLELLWSDSASGLLAARRDVVMACGNASGNKLTYYLYGPMHSDMFNVNVVNLDPAVTATVTYTINATSHVFEHDYCEQYQYVGTAPNGFTNPTGQPRTGLLAYTDASIPASSSNTYLCALFAGNVVLNIDNVSVASSVTVQLTDAAGFITNVAGSQLAGIVVPAAGSQSLSLALPFSPMTLKVSNTATVGAISPIVSMIAQQY